MPPRNLNIIIITVCISMLSYFTHRRTKTAMVVGDALNLIDQFYVDPISDRELLTAALDGMTNTLDEHSEFIPREEYESFQDNINQEFAGIGIYVDQAEPGTPVRVVTPLVGSPALQAGMLPDDLIIRVSGEDVSTMELSEVSKRLKGQIGTSVDLVLTRGDEEVAMSVQRARIKLESVIGDFRDEQNRWVYRLKDDPKIAYVRLTSFGEKTVKELRKVLQDLNSDFSGLVLDLRGNGGGLLHAAVDVSDMFLNSGRIVSTKTRGGVLEDSFDASEGTVVASSKPIAVLMDGNSASASEIVAACLQDHKRGFVVGSRSYGKGTVQNVLPLEYGRSALRLTVARYYRPNGKNIHRKQDATEEDEWGVIPSEGMAVTLEEEHLVALSKRWREASYPSLIGRTPRSQQDVDEEPDSETQSEPESESQESDDQQSEQTETGSAKSEAETSDAVDSEADDNEAVGSAEPEVTTSSDPKTSTIESSFLIDPQLRRAVEKIREEIEARKPITTAA